MYTKIAARSRNLDSAPRFVQFRVWLWCVDSNFKLCRVRVNFISYVCLPRRINVHWTLITYKFMRPRAQDKLYSLGFTCHFLTAKRIAW